MLKNILNKINDAIKAEGARLSEEWGLNDHNEHKRWDHAELKAKAAEAQRLKEIQEDYRISLENTRYLRAHISSSTSNLVNKKTRTAKVSAMKRIAWLESKLNEELNNVAFFQNQLT